MGKGGGGSSGPQTTTVKNQPYLASQVSEAANYAKNLYLGKGTNVGGSSSSSSSSSPSSTMYVGPDGRVYDISSKDWANSFIKSNPNNELARQYASIGGNSQTVKDNLLRNFKPMGGTSSGGETTTATGGVQVTPEGWPDYFPGQTYVDYSPETLQALDMISQRAKGGSALNTAANQSVLDTVNGNYLQSNPYMDSVINTSLDDVTRKYTDQVLPGLASNFASSGRYGSGIQQNLTAQAAGQLGKEAMGVASGIRYDNYNNERQRQLQAAALAPTLAQSDYYDAQQLMGVGSAQEALSQAKLQDAMDRFNYYENQPSNMLDQYIARLGSLNQGGGTQTTTGPGQQANRASPISGAVSGISTGLGIGSMFAAPGATGLAAVGGPWGLAGAAGLGILGGLFS